MLFKSLAAAALTVATFASTVAAQTVDPIVIKGSKMFYKTNGTEFFIRGIAYQQDASANGTTTTDTTFTDPLANPSNCQRDIPYLVALRTNVIRVYALDPTQNHDQCMSMLANAGIYVIADLAEPALSINRDTPAWNTALYARYTAVVDNMQQYTNTLGFFAGNEVSNNATNTQASPYVKAAIRDMKAYIKAKNYRTIGVGYATSDNADIRLALADYFNCGNQSDAIDFWGYNIYSWCGANSSYTISGYDKRTAEFQNYTVPAFFAEYGCNDPEPRYFDETLALFSDPMDQVWQGGIVYMYFEETNNYGLVTVSGNAVSKLPDFTALSTQIAKVKPTGTNSASYTPTNTVARNCPTATLAPQNSGLSWNASSNLPPTPNQALCNCMQSALTCVVSSSLSPTKYGSLFNYLFSAESNDGIYSNGVSGVYGAYSMCSAAQQLSWAMNNYYNIQKQSSSACNFNGGGALQSASTNSSCSAMLSLAGGVAGTATITGSVPGATQAGTSVSGSGSGSSTKKSAAAGRFDFGSVQTIAAVMLAAFSGIGMLIL